MSSIGWLCCKLVIPTLGLLLLLHACPLLRVLTLQLNQSWTFDELLFLDVCNFTRPNGVLKLVPVSAASSFFLILCIEMFYVPKKYESAFFIVWLRLTLQLFIDAAGLADSSLWRLIWMPTLEITLSHCIAGDCCSYHAVSIDREKD